MNILHTVLSGLVILVDISYQNQKNGEYVVTQDRTVVHEAYSQSFKFPHPSPFPFPLPWTVFVVLTVPTSMGWFYSTAVGQGRGGKSVDSAGLERRTSSASLRIFYRKNTMFCLLL